LNFLIQAPYKTTPNRENIPLDDEQNLYLIEETANLVTDSIPIIKELGLLNISFLEVLAIDQNHTDEIIYSSIFEKVKEKFLSDEALLPTSKQNFTTAQDTLLARGKELTELLDESDINVLFEKKFWLDTNITYDRTRQLRDYLINELDIQEVDFEDFAVTIKKEFIKQKSDEWLIDFYSRLLDQRSLWAKGGYYRRNAGILREKPIIRLADNTHIAPCDKDNKIQVYLPAETKSKYKTIKENLTLNENSLKFLTELGLSKPDIFAEIKEFVAPKYRDSDPDINLEEYFEDFEKILIAFQKEDSDKKKEMINDLKNLYIIYSTNSITDEHQFCKPDEVYFKTEDLVEYFKVFDKVFFVSDEIEKQFSDFRDTLVNLLISIGCENTPKKIEIDSDLSWDEKKNLRRDSGYSYTYDVYVKDYDIQGLNNFLKNITLDKSILLFNFLLSSLKSLDYWERKNFFYGEYCWTPRSRKHYEKFESHFLKMLKNTEWLVDKDDNFVLPTQISLSELSDSFSKDDENVDVLISVLGFQIDEIKQIEEKTGGKFVPKDEYEEFLKWKKEQSEKEAKEETEEDSWISEVAPESVEPIVEELAPEVIETPDFGGQRPIEYDDGNDVDESDTDEQDEVEKEKSIKQLKDIGNWGERFVYNYLKKQFENEGDIEIIWLNENRDAGKGYDFSIVSDGKEIEYIELKFRTP